MTNAWESIVYFYQQKLDNTLQDQSSSILDDFHFYIIFKNEKEDDKYLDNIGSKENFSWISACQCKINDLMIKFAQAAIVPFDGPFLITQQVLQENMQYT